MRFPDENVAVSGKIVSLLEATDLPGERRMMEILVCDAAADGVSLHPVKWADGVVALVPGNPADLSAWRNALEKTHCAAIAGALGPVGIGGAQ